MVAWMKRRQDVIAHSSALRDDSQDGCASDGPTLLIIGVLALVRLQGLQA